MALPISHAPPLSVSKKKMIKQMQSFSGSSSQSNLLRASLQICVDHERNIPTKLDSCVFIVSDWLTSKENERSLIDRYSTYISRISFFYLLCTAYQPWVGYLKPQLVRDCKNNYFFLRANIALKVFLYHNDLFRNKYDYLTPI